MKLLPPQAIWFRLAVCLFAWFAPAAARGEPVKFDLAAQPAAAALAAFAKQAGVEVLYSFEALQAVRTNEVVGSFEPEEALARMLRGTGFVGTRIARGKFVIVRERTGATGTVSGRVTTETGAPIPGARVRPLGSALASRTDANGFFLLPAVAVEAPGLVVQAEGFATTRIADVKIAAGGRTGLGDVRLRESDGLELLEEVVINADGLAIESMPFFALQQMVVTPSRFGLDQERGTLPATLTETELQALPQFGEDLYRTIARLPGLAADDYTARFWVRGAPHHQVLARLDGVTLIEPFHMKDTDSSLSIVDLESINRLDLYTGGFAADYGDRLGGVLLMETDTHVQPKTRTTLGLSMTGARVGSRGQTAGGHRWLVSGRTGYPDVAIESSDDGTKLKMRYHDVAAKWEWNVAPAHTLSLHALHAGDTGKYSDRLGLALSSRYDSDYVWARWRGSFGARVTGEAVLSYATHAGKRKGSGTLERYFAAEVDEERTLDWWALRQDWTFGWSERVLLRGGLEWQAGEGRYDYYGGREVPAQRDGLGVAEWREFRAKVEPDGRAAGGYLSARVQPWKSLTAEAGGRYDANTWADDADFSPRLNAAWTRGRTTLRAAWGLYHQAQGLHELGVADGDVTFRSAERAEHRVLSLEHRLQSGISLRLEGYERRVTRPRVHWGNTINNVSAFPELAEDRMRFDPRRQAARGIELIAERRGAGKVSWSANYTWSKTEETLRDGRTIPRARDQRHAVYADVTYTPNPRWQFSAAAQAHTGWPTTDEVYSLVPLATGERIVFGRPGVVYGTRLPAYQRLDLRAQRRFDLRRGTLRVYVDVSNALGRENVLEYDYVNRVSDGLVSSTRVPGDEQLQRLVTAGIAWDF